jgi:hypothetical protein
MHTGTYIAQKLYSSVMRLMPNSFACAGASDPEPWHFLYGSGSADPYIWLTDPAPEPSLFVSDLYEAKIK